MNTIAIRRTAGLATAAVLAAVLAIGITPALAASVDPVLVTGNADCNAATGLTQLTKIEPVTSQTKDGVTITVSGDSFSWSSTVTIAAVFVKGGPDGLLYDYRPAGATGDTGLHAPTNSSSGDYYGLSHVTFCVPDGSTTTTEPEDTTTTTQPEDTTTTTQPEAQEESTTTTTPEEVLSTTTSTTVAADEESTTTSEPVSTLPFTGTDTDTMGLVALAALMAGTGLVGLTRKSAESREIQRS
ncbi:MAG TPA: hypothetical protein VLB85_07805 [Acidimicrobiia bacterium]|nr:hypothetical protein [Acidimicrobiia bacterium]